MITRWRYWLSAELLSCNDSRTGGLHDELEYNIFNDFGCDGIGSYREYAIAIEGEAGDSLT